MTQHKGRPAADSDQSVGDSTLHRSAEKRLPEGLIPVLTEKNSFDMRKRGARGGRKFDCSVGNLSEIWTRVGGWRDNSPLNVPRRTRKEFPSTEHESQLAPVEGPS